MYWAARNQKEREETVALTNGHTRDERYPRISDYKKYGEGLERIFGKKWAEKKKKKKEQEAKRPDETGN